MTYRYPTSWEIVGIANSVEVTTASHALVTTGISGLQAGDLLIACIASRIASTTPVTLPTGGEWTLIGQQNASNTATNTSATPSATMAYCVRGASDPNLTFTHPTAPSVALGRIIAYRGCIPTSPMSDSGAGTTATNTTACSWTSFGTDTCNRGDLFVGMIAGGQEAAWSGINTGGSVVQSGATDTTSAPLESTCRERADSNTTTGADTSLAIFDWVAAATGYTTINASASIAAAHSCVAGTFKVAGTTQPRGYSDAVHRSYSW